MSLLLLTLRAYIKVVFPCSLIFEELYADSCKAAIHQYSSDDEVRQRFMTRIVQQMELMLDRLITDPKSHTAVLQHSENLELLWPHSASLKSSKSCFCCLMLMPEKVFDCGHSVCNCCIRRFGRQSPGNINAFGIPACLLCGVVQSRTEFHLNPPTAGIRMLCIDGGGIRGVVPLTFLQHLNQELDLLGSSLKDHFDYVCGTSAGKSNITRVPLQLTNRSRRLDCDRDISHAMDAR